jgi:hypothetical protein
MFKVRKVALEAVEVLAVEVEEFKVHSVLRPDKLFTSMSVVWDKRIQQYQMEYVLPADLMAAVLVVTMEVDTQQLLVVVVVQVTLERLQVHLLRAL